MEGSEAEISAQENRTASSGGESMRLGAVIEVAEAGSHGSVQRGAAVALREVRGGHVKQKLKPILHYASGPGRVEIAVEAPIRPIARSDPSQSLKLALGGLLGAS